MTMTPSEKEHVSFLLQATQSKLHTLHHTLDYLDGLLTKSRPIKECLRHVEEAIGSIDDTFNSLGDEH